MTIEGNKLFAYIIQCGFNETTNQKARWCSVEIELGNYHPTKHMRYFQYKDIEIIFDCTVMFILKKKRTIYTFFIYFAIPFQDIGQYPPVSEEALDYIQYKNVNWRRYIPAKSREIVFDIFGNQCADCGSRERLEIDHIYPVSLGGDNKIDNLQVLCKSCNIKKSNKV